jgi:putative flippase GtrA
MKRVLQHPLVMRHWSKFLRFAVCGGLGACIDFGTLLSLTRIAGWHPRYALFVSGVVSLVFVFLANKYFTFRETDDKRHGTQAGKFLLVYAMSALFNYILSLGFISVGAADFVAKALAIGIMMFVNYAFLHGFVFRRRRQAVAAGA